MQLASVLLVCTGNICRSPMAHALLLQHASRRGMALAVDSAAISDGEQGRPPDARALAELQRRGVTMPAHRARPVHPGDFRRFDLLVGMTHAHCAALRRQAPPECAHKVRLLLDYSSRHAGREVPDPWYGPQQAFIEVYDLIAAGVEGLLQALGPATRGRIPAACG